MQTDEQIGGKPGTETDTDTDRDKQASRETLKIILMSTDTKADEQ